EMSGVAQLTERLIETLQPGEREAERMMQPRVLRRGGDRRGQRAFSIAVPDELAIKIGEVDRRRRVLRAQPQRSLVFDLGIRKEATSGEKISQGGAGLRPIGIEALGGDELGRRALERFAIGGRPTWR